MKTPEDLQLEVAGLRGQIRHLKGIIRTLKENHTKTNDWNASLQEHVRILQAKLASCSSDEQNPLPPTEVDNTHEFKNRKV